MVHTGSTLSQLLYFPVKSKPKTCPQTDVILYETDSPVGGNFPLYSWMEQAPLEPFLEFICPPDNIFAIDWAREGFSATIKTVFIVYS